MKIKKMIIAEIGSTHDGSLAVAKKSIKVASESGANAVKFQMHIAEDETLKNAPSPKYFKNEKRYEYFKRTAFSINQWKILFNTCKKYKVEFLCSPFSLKAVEILEDLGVKAYKIPSGEVTNIPLLNLISRKKKPVLLSTGMSNWKEIEIATSIFKKNKLIVMQCSSQYPCSLKNVGSNVFSEIKKKFKCDFGYSDHTLGYSASFLAASLGAKVIEKHFTLSKKFYGSDAKFSMEPKEFKLFTKTINEIWSIQDYPVNKNSIKKYHYMKKVFEKSIVAKRFIPINKKISLSDLNFKKPGNGIRADQYKKIIGKFAKINIQRDRKIKISDLYVK